MSITYICQETLKSNECNSLTSDLKIIGDSHIFRKALWNFFL